MSVLLKGVIFLVVTAGFIWLSWRCLHDWRSHGFYRFFAFESISALILLNLDFWFYKPFSFHQIISWLLLLISSLLVIHGVWVLREAGKHDSRRNDRSLIGIEKTAELVTTGAYRYIRHPIYSAGLIGTWGVFFKHPSITGLCLALATTIFLTVTAKIEEGENLRFFGDAYSSYMKQTRMFIPYLF